MEEANKVAKEIRDMGVEAIALAADCKWCIDDVICITHITCINSVCFLTILGSNQDDIKKMFKEVVDRYGRCDILVNNAGIARDNNLIRCVFSTVVAQCF